MGEGDYCPDCGVSDPEDGCPECGRPCENKFHGEHADGAEVERLREALGAVFQLAAVSWEGDPWYAEEEGIDGEAVLAQGRAALHHDEKEEE